MAKDIRIIPASGLIAFSGSNEQSTLTVADDGKIALQGSGSTIFDIQGSQGQLFSVTDSLVGSLFSVNDISGIPILEVFDNDKVVMGTFGQNTLVVSGSNVAIGTGSFDRRFTIAENTTYLSIGEHAGYTPSVYGPVLQTNSGTMVMPGHIYLGNSNSYMLKTGTSTRLHGDGGILFSYYNGSTITGMNLTNTGFLGLGTTSPSSLFEIHKDSTNGQIATYRNDTGFFLHRTYADYNNDGTTVEYQERIGVDGNYSRIGNFSNHPFYLMTNNSTNMTLLTNGNVGIGTTSPDRQLQVHASDSGTSAAKFTNSTTGEDGDTGFFVGINGSEEPILFGYNNTDMRFGTNGLDRMRITAAGNVGIGTTTPSAQLELRDGTGLKVISANAKIQFGDSTMSQFLKMDGSGNLEILRNNESTVNVHFNQGGSVGINNSAPSGALHIKQPGAASVQTKGYETSAFPDLDGNNNALLTLDGNYATGQYRSRFVKVDRGGNLSLYYQETGGTAHDYDNIVRLGANSHTLLSSKYLEQPRLQTY